MKLKKDLLLILAPVIIILILVIIKSVDMNSFSLTTKETLDLSLDDNHILSIGELKTKHTTEKNFAFIDLRSTEKFSDNHLPNAVNIPFQNILQIADIENNIKENKSIVLYSDTSAQSAKAWMILTQMGYQQLYILDIPGNLISEELFLCDIFPEGDEVLKYKFQPDTLIRPESIN